MRCRSMPITAMTMNTIAITRGTDSATTMPVRQPSDRKLTNSTIPSASAKERRNSLTAVYAGRPDIFDDPVPMRLAVATEGYMQGAITRSTDGRRAEVFLNIRDKAAFYEYVLRQLRRD